MKNKIETLMNTSKKKSALAIMSGMLVLALGTGAAYAAGSDDETSAIKINNEKGMSLTKNENGKISYSTDNGQTWTQGTPEGTTVTTDQDGKELVKMGTPPKDGDGMGLMVKNENGKISYSTDGGKTWSEKAPEGFDVKEEDGNVSVKKK